MSEVRATLERLRRRVWAQAAGEQALPWALGAALAAEAAWVVAPWNPSLAWAALALGGCLAGVGCARAARTPHLTTVWTAALVDARLGTGGCVAAGAEALEGQHPRFAAASLAAAEDALAGVSVGRVAPWRLPAGLGWGLAAAVLVPWLAPSDPAAQAAVASRPVSLLAPSEGGGGGEAAPASFDEANGWAPTQAQSEGGEDPLSGLPPEVAEAVRERLEAWAAQAPSPPAEGTGGVVGESALEEALRRGEAAGVLRALEEALDRAGEGDQAAAATLAEAAERWGRPGSGAADGGEGGEIVDGRGGLEVEAVWEGGEGLPVALREAATRYFEGR